MKKVIIVCAGNHAREIHAHIYRANKLAEERQEEKPYDLLGFINDYPDSLNNTGIKEPILGTIKEWYPKDDEWYIMGTAEPSNKEKLAKMLKERGCRFTSFIAPSAIVPNDLHMGEGCVIQAYRVGCNVALGDFVSINGSMIMSGASIDSFSTTTGFTVVEKAKVGKCVYIGSHAVITEGVSIGDDARVSIGSIVDKDVIPGTTVFGVPADSIG